MVFLEIDGSVKDIDLAGDEKLIVQTGNAAAFESTICHPRVIHNLNRL